MATAYSTVGIPDLLLTFLSTYLITSLLIDFKTLFDDE